MENKLVTRWRDMRSPAGSLQTHLEGQIPFFGGDWKQSLYFFQKTRDTLLIFNLYNPFVITWVILSVMSNFDKTKHEHINIY